jgi:hypothetical protein
MRVAAPPISQEAGMTTVSAQRLASIFVEVADTLVEEFDLIDFLHLLTDRTADLTGAAAVGLMLADGRGNLEFMAGSNEDAKLLELFQLQAQEGPCLEAYRSGQAVINVDLSAATSRRPLFAPGRPRSGSSPCTPSRCGSANRSSAR